MKSCFGKMLFVKLKFGQFKVKYTYKRTNEDAAPMHVFRVAASVAYSPGKALT